MSWSLVVSVVLAGLAVGVAVVAPDRRRQLLFGALFSLPIVLLEFVAAGSFARLGASTWAATVYLVVTTLLVMALGGLLAVLVDLTINRWFTPAVHHRRHTLGWLAIGLIVVLVLMATGRSIGLALLIGLMVNGFVLVTLDRLLIWDAIISAAAFGLWFVVADVVFGIRAAGDIHQFLIGQNPIGLTLDGVPTERVLVLFMAGLMLGPLFAATKRRRHGTLPTTTTVSHAKVLTGIFVTLLGVGGLAWWSVAYVVPPRVLSVQPIAGATVALDTSAITIQFSRPVSRDDLSLTLEPAVGGWWVFSQPSLSDHGYRQATLVLADPLTAATTYRGTITGIHSIWGFASPDIQISFTTVAAPVTPVAVTPAVPVVIIPPPAPVVPVPTQAPVVAPTPTVVVAKKYLLSIAMDYQDDPLSCEAAALKMALAGVGVHVTEGQIMKLVGYDPTPHSGNVWGNPNVGFVGNIAGKQNTSGYGVYWGPIAKAASHWRTARIITNGTPEMLAAEIMAGHPVVVWGTIGNAYRDDWKTATGASILAWKGEHARTLVGIVGTATHPTAFILNDPVVGRITWTRAQFDANWARFNRSAVVIE